MTVDTQRTYTVTSVQTLRTEVRLLTTSSRWMSRYVIKTRLEEGWGKEDRERKRRTYRDRTRSLAHLSRPQSTVQDKSLDVMLLLTNGIARNSALSYEHVCKVVSLSRRRRAFCLSFSSSLSLALSLSLSLFLCHSLLIPQ